MILQIQHETRLEYSAPVTEWLAEVRMEPVSDDDQQCHSFHLRVGQSTSHFRYQDGFGNRVHHFNLINPLQEVRILAASVVETGQRVRDVAGSRATYPIRLTDIAPESFSYLMLRGPVRSGGRLARLLPEVAPAEGVRFADHVIRVAHFIHERFEYAPATTNVSSPVDDLLEQGKGVCQDFAHLMIAILRTQQVPARYVSGYIHRPSKESQSHAWCEAWVPDVGWLGIDPTNDRLVGEDFVKVAVGRDFTDVTPNKGIYRGTGQEKMSVRVESAELKRVPPISWQENLPPLDAPLQAIRHLGLRRGEMAEEQAQQQMQQ